MDITYFLRGIYNLSGMLQFSTIRTILEVPSHVYLFVIPSLRITLHPKLLFPLAQQSLNAIFNYQILIAILIKYLQC